MKPLETLDSVTTPDGHRLSLHRRDGDVYICLDGEELISTRAPGSESELGRMACSGLARSKHPRVLIGGLGLGYTLRAALEVLPAGASVVVAEVFAAVTSWNRDVLADLHCGSLEDPRVEIVERDVWFLINEPGRRLYDAILLDVDNGPDAWCLESNSRLYSGAGLDRIKRALSPGGLLAIWSSDDDRTFVKRLGKNGFDASSTTVRSRGRKGTRHTIFMARKQVDSRGRPKGTHATPSTNRAR